MMLALWAGQSDRDAKVRNWREDSPHKERRCQRQHFILKLTYVYRELYRKLLESKYIYDERELLVQVAAGSESAFRQLFYQYRPRLIAFVLGLSRSEQAAEDIVHDLFLDLWKNRERLPEVEHFSTYLFRAVQYKAQRHLQRRAKETLILAELRREEYGVAYAEQQETLSLQAVQHFLRQSLNKLTPQQRRIFLLSRENNLSHTQIADKLGIQSQTVSNHLSDALRVLREEIDAFYGPLAIALFVLHRLG